MSERQPYLLRLFQRAISVLPRKPETKRSIELGQLEHFVIDGREIRRLPSVSDIASASNVELIVRGKVGHKPFDVLSEIVRVALTTNLNVTLLMRNSEDLADERTWDAIRDLSFSTGSRRNIVIGVVDLDIFPEAERKLLRS